MKEITEIAIKDMSKVLLEDSRVGKAFRGGQFDQYLQDWVGPDHREAVARGQRAHICRSTNQKVHGHFSPIHHHMHVFLGS